MPKIFIITPVAVHTELWNVAGEMQLRAVKHPASIKVPVGGWGHPASVKVPMGSWGHPASVSVDGGLGVVAGETGMGGAPSS